MKKLRGFGFMLLISLLLFGLTACQGEDSNTPSYEQITAKEAKTIMDSEENYIIMDARTLEEYDEGHIEGAVCFPYEDVKAKAHVVLPEKDKQILVYCRSGRRSKIAAETLCELGYTNVKEFGGIIDWPYEVVK